MKSDLEITMLPTYSEDGSVITIIIGKADGSPISNEELTDSLVEFVRYLDNKEDDLKN